MLSDSIRTLGAGWTLCYDFFQEQSLLVEATLLSFKIVHACNLSNSAATWLQAHPNLNFKILKHC